MPTREACHYDASGIYVQPHGLPFGSLALVSARLNALRQAVLNEAKRLAPAIALPMAGAVSDSEVGNAAEDAVAARQRGEVTTDSSVAADPLTMLTWLLMRPCDVLRAYEIHRRQSELERVLTIARVLAEDVDRLVVLGDGVAHVGAMAVFQCCCHPYHNELSAGERAGGPRLYFDGRHFDSDARAAILDLLPQRPSALKDERWGLVVSSAGPHGEAVAMALAEYLPRLHQACRSSEQFARRFVAIARQGDWLYRMVQEQGGGELILLPPYSQVDSFGAATMLPLAAAGVDVVRYLRGAAAMTERFRSTALGLNPVLDLAGLGHLLSANHGLARRIVTRTSPALAGLESWWQAFHLAAQSVMGTARNTPEITFAETAAATARLAGGETMQLVQLVVESSRRNLVALGKDATNSLTERVAAVENQLAEVARSAGMPLVRLLVPRASEACLGQLMQLLPAVSLCERLLQADPAQG